MIVWQLTGSEIGPNDCGAYYFATKREAEARHREWMEAHEGIYDPPTLERLVIKDREALAAALNDAMGYGGS
jgi:hypothetical protein